MRPNKIVIIGIAMLTAGVLNGGVQAQNVQINAFAQDLSILFLSDLDLSRTGGGIPVFWISLESDVDVMVYLRIIMECQNYGIIATGTTKDFLLEKDFPRQISNTNLFGQADNYSFDSYDWNQDIANTLRDRILATSRLPSDIYRLIIEAYDAGTDQLYDRYILSLDITNPTTLDLLSPGSRVEDDELPLVFTTFPQFHWESNMDLFRLVVAEKKAAEHEGASPEEVINDEIRLEKYIKVYRGVGGLPVSTDPDTIASFATFLQYPASGVLPLESGKTYFWQITGLPATSGTQIELGSEIWGFTIADLTDLALTPEQAEILSLLRSIIGDDLVDQFLALGGDLNGFEPTGKIVDASGVTISLESLRLLMAKFLSGEFQVIEVIIE